MYKVCEQVNSGAHGVIFKGEDAFGRPVAIKFIGPSVGDEKFISEQAAALARVQSDGVIHVITTENLENPSTKVTSLAMVMEWLEGETLEDWLRSSKASLQDVKRIGAGLIQGVRAIHDAFLVHQDLHTRNVMVGNSWVKIIDILYLGTLAVAPEQDKASRRQTDRNRVRTILSDLLSKVSLPDADSFSRSLSQESSLDEIRDAFEIAITPKVYVDIEAAVGVALKRVTDSAFVDSNEYAVAISEEIDNRVIRPLMEAMIVKECAIHKHTSLLKLLWDRMGVDEKRHVCVNLSSAIDRETPAGNYAPPLYMLISFGSEGWNLLQRATSIRLEKVIVDDIKLGSYEAQSDRLTRGGVGTSVKSLFQYFTNKEQVIDAFVEKLNGQWTSQNYIGKYFMKVLPRFVSSVSDRESLIEGIKKSISDNAWTVKANLNELPEDWRNDIKKLEQE